MIDIMTGDINVGGLIWLRSSDGVPSEFLRPGCICGGVIFRA